MYDNELIDRLNFLVNNDFVRLTYTVGVKILEESGHSLSFPVLGADLQSELDRTWWKTFQVPVSLRFPRRVKSFYINRTMTKNCRAMDVLFPKIGEIIGGSEREVNYDTHAACKEIDRHIDPIGGPGDP